jgi:adenylate cyclase
MTIRSRRLVFRLAACVLISVSLAALSAVLGSEDLLGRFEVVPADLAFPRGQVDPSVAVVAFDARALAEVDASWPWPRHLHAQLVRALTETGARLIVIDVAFAAPAEGDAELADALRDSGRVLLSSSALSTVDEADQRHSAVLRPTVVRPVATLADAAVGVGHTHVSRDATDGVVRVLPLVVEDGDRRLLPSLSLAALALSEGEPPDPIVRRPTGVQVGNRAIPTNSGYELTVSYPPELSRPKTAPPIVSAADVLEGESDVDLRDKVVFVGVTDVSLGDRLPTPVARASGLPGVQIHASAFDTMVSRAYIGPASILETTLWVLLVALVITFSVQFLPAWLAGAVALGLLVFYLLVAYLRVDAGVVMNFTYPTIAVAFAVPLSGGVRYLVETRQRRRVAALFSQYVPDRVATQLIDEGRVASATAGERVVASALFCDLRGFTELSAQLEPTQVNDVLTDFYEYASAIVAEHDGTLMTYIGDEIFVIFGAPVPTADHAARAVECTRQLQEHVSELDATLESHAFAPLRFGIGVNAGELVAVHAGSSRRRQYTAIGDTVNVASRLCGQAGPGQVVLSDATVRATGQQLQIEPLGHREMKGVPADFVAWKLVLDRPPPGTRDR